MTIEISTERVRNLLSTIKKSQATTVDAEAFLQLFGDQLKQELDSSISNFIYKKLQ